MWPRPPVLFSRERVRGRRGGASGRCEERSAGIARTTFHFSYPPIPVSETCQPMTEDPFWRRKGRHITRRDRQSDFNPENLAVGATGSYEGVAGIAPGSIVGAAMVALALAYGITALPAPIRHAVTRKGPHAVLVLGDVLVSRASNNSGHYNSSD